MGEIFGIKVVKGGVQLTSGETEGVVQVGGDDIQSIMLLPWCRKNVSPGGSQYSCRIGPKETPNGRRGCLG